MPPSNIWVICLGQWQFLFLHMIFLGYITWKKFQPHKNVNFFPNFHKKNNILELLLSLKVLLWNCTLVYLTIILSTNTLCNKFNFFALFCTYWNSSQPQSHGFEIQKFQRTTVTKPKTWTTMAEKYEHNAGVLICHWHWLPNNATQFLLRFVDQHI